jgi:hypothetical protein
MVQNGGVEAEAGMNKKLILIWQFGRQVTSIPGETIVVFARKSVIARHWKYHLKNDRRSVQDHRLKLDRRSDQDHPFKKMILDQDQIIYHFLPLFEGHFLNFLIKHF